MGSIRQVYSRLDNWVYSLSRTNYAVLLGFIAALGALAVGLVFEESNYAFAVGIGLTLTALNYISNPNQKKE